MSKELESVLACLAKLVGDASGDFETDHGRWQLYVRAIESSVGSDLLLSVVALEDDTALATSVVLRMLELVTDEQQSTWIDKLPLDARGYSQKRGFEIRVLRRATAGELAVAETVADIDGWSDWLQLRLATAAVDREALTVISKRGRTKRIRNSAIERLKYSAGRTSLDVE